MAATKYTCIVTSNEPERIFPPFILALGARAMDMDAVLFFTMSGLQALVKGEADKIELGGKKLGDMLRQAKDMGVRLLACSTALEIAGIKPEDLEEGIEVVGVATYLSEAADNAICNSF